MTKYRQVELKLRQIVESRIDEGWLLTPGRGFVDMDTAACCALGSVVANEWETLPNSTVRIASQRLGISPDEAWSISNGFEDEESHQFGVGKDKKFIAVGARIRRDYFEGAE